MDRKIKKTFDANGGYGEGREILMGTLMGKDWKINKSVDGKEGI